MKKIFWILGILAVLGLIFFVLVPSFSGQLIINPVVRLGSFSFHIYGVILAASILLAYGIVRKNSWKFGISTNEIDDFGFWLILIGILGARIYYVLFSLSFFTQNPAEIYKIWHGGISIYGGLLSGLLFTYLYAKNKAYTFLQLADLIVLGIPLAQALGRFGNFVNQEAYGVQTNLPWKMYVPTTGTYVHPTFLYEALGNVLIFLLLIKLSVKVKSGTLLLTYLCLYSLLRFFIEGIRVDSFFIYSFRVDQLIAFAIFLTTGTLLYRRYSRAS